ncbi:MAG TPA: Maf family protein [Pyrinomonadaceae bacterium]|jgi:septum formation protein|nr:Maf family protein [Pyrinomonadaceae bacterium]
MKQNANHLREKLVLASGSPRRAEILERAGWPYEIIVAGIDETLLPNEEAAAYVQRLARSKAEKVASGLDHGLVLGADTTVVVDDQILGQPLDEADARRMLDLLNAKWHEVLTGVALVRVGGETRVGYETTRVRFAEMSDEEIDWYTGTGEPFGKAGAYGIQGKASLFIEEIEGDYFNIMGLPIRLVYELSVL